MPRSREAAKRWRDFVGETLDKFGQKAELIEVGSTCNRRKWAGYLPAGLLHA